MDYTHNRERAGCPDLFTTIARIRPRMHCFGHIHEGWGAKLVTWRASTSDIDKPSHFTAIDNEHSRVIGKLAMLRENALDSDDTVQEKLVKLERLRRDNCATTSHTAQDEHPLQVGKQTLFVNAAIESNEDFVQRPWLVDIEIPKHVEVGEKEKGEEKMGKEVPEQGKENLEIEVSETHKKTIKRTAQKGDVGHVRRKRRSIG